MEEEGSKGARADFNTLTALPRFLNELRGRVEALVKEAKGVEELKEAREKVKAMLDGLWIMVRDHDLPLDELGFECGLEKAKELHVVGLEYLQEPGETVEYLRITGGGLRLKELTSPAGVDWKAYMKAFDEAREGLWAQISPDLSGNTLTVISEVPFRNVYEWASKLTAEARGYDRDAYCWTVEGKRLLRTLTLSKRNLIAVVGLQGVGKTSLMQALQDELSRRFEKTYRIKWLGRASLHEQLYRYDDYGEAFFDEYLDKLAEYLLDKLGEKRYLSRLKAIFGEQSEEVNLISRYQGLGIYRGFNREKSGIRKDQKLNDLLLDFKEDPIALYVTGFGQTGNNPVKRDFVDNYLSGSHTLLIDLRDFDKKSRGQLIKDLDEIQLFWNDLMRFGCRLNLVLFFQRELFHGHFLMGKCSVIELKPLRPEEMLEVYRRKFNGLDPFTEDSLKELASSSRGIMRRFLKYVRLALDYWYDHGSQGALDLKLVGEAVGFEQRAADMELELAELYPNSKEKRVIFVGLLEFLRRTGPINQTELTRRFFNDKPMEASRMLNKAQAYGYVTKKREGREYIIQVA